MTVQALFVGQIWVLVLAVALVDYVTLSELVKFAKSQWG